MGTEEERGNKAQGNSCFHLGLPFTSKTVGQNSDGVGPDPCLCNSLVISLCAIGLQLMELEQSSRFQKQRLFQKHLFTETPQPNQERGENEDEPRMYLSEMA
jgi:hypothetical protein